ncbi:MAG TPA: alanine racemase [Xanthobacteraceae bacterium]|nr:alanine racemase [Xanthobacteraceae bacterium]
MLTIDLAAIAANWRALSERAAPAECGAVVKADGYGLGLEPVARTLRAEGCRTFFVAQLAEGRRLRMHDRESAIYVLNGLLPGTAAAYAAHDLRPVLGSVAEVNEWIAFRASADWRGGAAMHVDTGMNRLGLTFREAAALAERDVAVRAGVDLLMSHFAVSEDAAHPLNARQMGLFRDLRALYPGLRASLANSSGIFLGPDAHHDLVRPGVALYGANPTPGHANPMRACVRLEARVVQVRAVTEGDTVGYGAAWTARRPSRIAVVAAGYADGFLRSAGATDRRREGADATVAGRRCLVAGRISMDLLAIDVTDCDEGVPRRGDLVTLIDDDIGIDQVADRAGTIAYEILTSLGRRYARVYRK